MIGQSRRIRDLMHKRRIPVKDINFSIMHKESRFMGKQNTQTLKNVWGGSIKGAEEKVKGYANLSKASAFACERYFNDSPKQELFGKLLS